MIEEGLGVSDGESGGLADVLVVNQDGASLGAKALAPAVGAKRVATVFREEDADVQLVFLAFERTKEALNAGVAIVALFDEALLPRQ